MNLNFIKNGYTIAIARYKGLKILIKTLLILSISSIVLIEFFLNKINAKFQFQYDFGVVYLKLCYSYFSAFIFYYIIVYAPKERKKVKIFHLINNNISSLGMFIGQFLEAIIGNDCAGNKTKLTLDEITEICKNTNPQNPVKVYFLLESSFNNYYELYYISKNQVKLRMDELIILNDLIDEDLLGGLTDMNINITEMTIFNFNKNEITNMELIDIYICGLQDALIRTKKSHWNYRQKYARSIFYTNQEKQQLIRMKLHK